MYTARCRGAACNAYSEKNPNTSSICNRAALNKAVYEIFGYRLGYRWDHPEGESLLQQVVLPNWVPVSGEAQAWVGFTADRAVYEGDSFWTRAADEETLRHRVQQLTQLVLTENASDVTFLHAGVVRFHGRLVLSPGRSKSGKTSLVRALVQGGGQFYSDEFAVFDDDGLVHSYPRPLWTRVTRKLRKATPAPDLGWSAELGPDRVSVVLLGEYRAGAHWNPRPLSLDDAVQACLEHVQGPQRGSAGRRLRRGLAQSLCYAGLRGEAAEVVSWLRAS